jgi:hypothetical protein
VKWSLGQLDYDFMKVLALCATGSSVIAVTFFDLSWPKFCETHGMLVKFGLVTF